LLAVANSGGVEGAADDVVLDRREVLHSATADEDHGVLLEVVADARDVGRDLHLVGEPDARDLAQRRVRLLGRHRPDLEADTALLRGAGRGDLLAVQAIPVLAHGRRLDLLDLGLATVAHELADRRHEDAAPLIGVGSAGRRSPAGGRFASGQARGDLPGVDCGVARQLGPGDAHVDRGPLPRPRTRSVSAARKQCQTSGRYAVGPSNGEETALRGSRRSDDQPVGARPLPRNRPSTGGGVSATRPVTRPWARNQASARAVPTDARLVSRSRSWPRTRQRPDVPPTVARIDFWHERLASHKPEPPIRRSDRGSLAGASSASSSVEPLLAPTATNGFSAAASSSPSLASSSVRNGLNSPSSDAPAIVAASARPAASSAGRPPSSRNGLYSAPPSSIASPARASRAARRSRSLRAATLAGAPVPAGISLPMMTFSLSPIR